MRDIDEIIQAVKDHPSIPPVHKQVLINRIEPEPTREELDRARDEVYPQEAGFIAAWCEECGALVKIPHNQHETPSETKEAS